MLLNNRRAYINRYSNSKSETNQKSSNYKESKDEQKDMKDMIIEALKSISENISRIKQSIVVLDEKVEKIESRQIALENQIDSDYTERRRIPQPEFSSNKNEHEIFKTNTIDMNQEKKENIDNKPIMPGSGFSNITPEFLRNLNKK